VKHDDSLQQQTLYPVHPFQEIGHSTEVPTSQKALQFVSRGGLGFSWSLDSVFGFLSLIL
jgi:hypothetical protein